MDSHGLLPQLVFTAGLALVVLIIAGRLKIPALVALIFAGIIVGPSAFAIVATREDVEMLAEIGVVLLMFTVGLEFSFVGIKPMLRVTLLGGVLQMVLTTVAVLGITVWWLPNIRLGVFIGLFLALTSTAILLKELAARNAVNAPHGRLVVAVALVQDMASIVLLALLPFFGGHPATESLGWTALRALAAVLSVLAFGSFVLPRLIRIVSASRNREAFSLAVVVASLGTAWFTSQLGVSMALGAFLAGLVLADSEFSHQIHAEIRPLRDILTSLFFISVGMIIDFHTLLPRLPLLLAAAAVLIVVKSVASGGALLAVGVPLRPAVIAGILLVPVGEFSFVIGRAALESGFLSTELWQLLLGTSVVTMIVAPWLVAVAPAVGQWFVMKLGTKSEADTQAHAGLSDRVIVLGFGVGGRMMAQAMRDISVPYLILELNGATVRDAARQGESIIYGDAANPDALEAAGVHRARAVVALLSDPDATLRAVRTIRGAAPEIPIITRTRYRVEADRLQRAGATLAVAEELEASLEVLAQTMIWLGVPGNVVQVLLESVRRDITAGMSVRAPTVPLMAVPDAIQRSPVATHRIESGAWAVGRTLGDVALRTTTGATVLAIQAGERYLVTPMATQALEAGHVLFLLGDESDILLARAMLTEGPRLGKGVADA